MDAPIQSYDDNEQAVILYILHVKSAFYYMLRKEKDKIVKYYCLLVMKRMDIWTSFYVLSKLFSSVVYLDADTIVLKNIDDLFKCGKFCANLKHSERMNSGVMVVEPSEAVFKDMMSKVNTLPSYTGGLCLPLCVFGQGFECK